MDMAQGFNACSVTMDPLYAVSNMIMKSSFCLQCGSKWNLLRFPPLIGPIQISIYHWQAEPFPGQNLFWTHAMKFFQSEAATVEITERNISKLAKKAAVQYVAAVPVKRSEPTS